MRVLPGFDLFIRPSIYVPVSPLQGICINEAEQVEDRSPDRPKSCRTIPVARRSQKLERYWNCGQGEACYLNARHNEPGSGLDIWKDEGVNARGRPRQFCCELASFMASIT